MRSFTWPDYTHQQTTPTFCRCRFIAHTADLSALCGFHDTPSSFVKSHYRPQLPTRVIPSIITVILSNAKDLPRMVQMLRCSQHDNVLPCHPEHHHCHPEQREAPGSGAKLLRHTQCDRQQLAVVGGRHAPRETAFTRLRLSQRLPGRRLASARARAGSALPPGAPASGRTQPSSRCM
jgi:hypothetical protein